MPSIKKVRVFDPYKISRDGFINFAKENYPDLDVIYTDSVKSAVKDADIVTTTTPSREPIVEAGYISEGTHINAIGADAKGKQELDSKLLKMANVVIDNWEQSSHSGEINNSVSNGYITQKNIHADIGEIVTGKKIGRDNPNQISIFDSTGLALQDIFPAYAIFQKLMSKKDELKRFNYMA